MEDSEILNLWRSYDKKLEENLSLNKQNAEDITKMKVRSFLGSMRPLKIFSILIGILWVVFVDTLIVNLFPVANPFFLVSAIIHVLLTKLAIGVYLYQLILIQTVDINEPILATQEKIARLKSSTLWVTRLIFLQLPVWSTFYWNESMLETGNAVLYIIQAMVTGSLTFLSVWLFRNIKYENRDKKWFRLMFDGPEWTPAVKSMELLKQISDYKSEKHEGKVGSRQ